MNKAKLLTALHILELTAHSCVNKVAFGTQRPEDAHAEIRREWGLVYDEVQKKRRRKS